MYFPTDRHCLPQNEGKHADQEVTKCWSALADATLFPALPLLSLLIIAPWLLGGRTAYLLQYICVGVTVCVAFWFFSRIRGCAKSIDIPLVALPVLFAILFGLFQLTPLSTETITKFSPVASHLWQLSEQSGNDAVKGEGRGNSSRQTISLYPASTRSDVSLLVLASIVFIVSAQLFAQEQVQGKLWWLLLGNGAALSIFGIIQQLTWNGKLYWFYKPSQVNMAFGPYVNHNHAAGYLLMCLGGGLGLLMSNQMLRRDSTRQSESIRRKNKSLSFLAGFLTLCVVIGILCSLSRGAFVAMAGAGVITLSVSALYAGRGLKFPYQLVAVAMLAVVILIGIGLSSTVSDRLDSITKQDVTRNTRIQHWRQASRTVPDFWLTGSGLGTYRYIHRLYMTQPGEEWFYHAENQYLEAMVEGGVVGLGLLLVAMVLMVVVSVFSLRKAPGIRSRPFALAVLFALTSQSIHAFFDFGLYAPANMLLLAAICGAGAGQACQFSDFSRWPRLITFLRLRSPLVTGVFILALVLQSLFPLTESYKATVMHSAHTRFVNEMRDPGLPTEDKEISLLNFSARLQRYPDDLRYQLAIADGWIEQYRERAYRLLVEKKDGTERDDWKQNPKGEVSRNRVIWEQTSLAHLDQLAGRWYRSGYHRSLRNLRDQQVVKETLRPAFRHLLLARRASPLLPRVHFSLAQLSFLVREPEGSNPYLQPITQMAYRRADLMYQAGLYYFEQADYERAVDCWKISLAESELYAAAIYQHSLSLPDRNKLPIGSLPFSASVLIDLAKNASEQEDGADRLALLRRAEKLLLAEGESRAETFYQLAVVSELKNSPDEAIDHFKKALELAPRNLEWRFQYAQLLQKQGKYGEALKQAKACTQADGSNSMYRELYLAVYSKKN